MWCAVVLIGLKLFGGACLPCLVETFGYHLILIFLLERSVAETPLPLQRYEYICSSKSLSMSSLYRPSIMHQWSNSYQPYRDFELGTQWFKTTFRDAGELLSCLPGYLNVQNQAPNHKAYEGDQTLASIFLFGRCLRYVSRIIACYRPDYSPSSSNACEPQKKPNSNLFLPKHKHSQNSMGSHSPAHLEARLLWSTDCLNRVY
jgi:hypothetical protein